MIDEPAVALQAQLGKAFPGFAAGVVQGRRQLTVASDGFPEQWQQGLCLPGFFLVAKDPAFIHGIEGNVHLAPGGSQNPDNGRMRLTQLIQQLFALHARHPLVRHHHCNRRAWRSQMFQCRFRSVCGKQGELILQVFELTDQIFRGGRFVIDNEHNGALPLGVRQRWLVFGLAGQLRACQGRCHKV